jgi:hypothetical protein
MSTYPNLEIKKEPIDNDDHHHQAEILSEITVNNQNRNNVIYTTSVIPVKSEFNTTTTANNQNESNKDEKIKQLEQIQEMLFEKIRIKSNENEILKQNEMNLIARNNELNYFIEMNTNYHEITSLKEKIFEANEDIEIKKNDIIFLKIQIDKYELNINEMNQKLKGIRIRFFINRSI